MDVVVHASRALLLAAQSSVRDDGYASGSWLVPSTSTRPEPWQWPTISFMFRLGVGALMPTWRSYAAEYRTLRRRRTTDA